MRPPMPTEERTCNICPSHPIEDEYHFMTQCIKYVNDRKELYEKIEPICPNFKYLMDKDKFIYMLTSAGEITKLVAGFIARNLP